MVTVAPVEVHSVIFRPDQMVEITYAEAGEVSPSVSLVRTIVLDRAKFLEDIVDIELALFELVDEGLLALRNPPATEPVNRTA